VTNHNRPPPLLQEQRLLTRHLPSRRTIPLPSSANLSRPDRLLQPFHLLTTVFPTRTPTASSSPASLVCLLLLQLRLLPLLSLCLPSPSLLLPSLGKISLSRKALSPSRFHQPSPTSYIYPSRSASVSTLTWSTTAIMVFTSQKT
jgi:hypothetical protein